MDCSSCGVQAVGSCTHCHQGSCWTCGDGVPGSGHPGYAHPSCKTAARARHTESETVKYLAAWIWFRDSYARSWFARPHEPVVVWQVDDQGGIHAKATGLGRLGRAKPTWTRAAEPCPLGETKEPFGHHFGVDRHGRLWSLTSGPANPRTGFGGSARTFSVSLVRPAPARRVRSPIRVGRTRYRVRVGPAPTPTSQSSAAPLFGSNHSWVATRRSQSRRHGRPRPMRPGVEAS